jgi:hypothetical protein
MEKQNQNNQNTNQKKGRPDRHTIMAKAQQIVQQGKKTKKRFLP